MCSSGLMSPTRRWAAQFWGGAYRPDDETDRRLTAKYQAGDKSAAQEIRAYRKERAENEKAPRPTSAQTTDENIEAKVKKKKEALGAMVKAKDRDTILASTIKADRNTLG